MCSNRIGLTLLLKTVLLILFSNESSSMEMEKHFPSYAVITNSYILENSSKCRIELNSLKKGIDDRKLWSLRILDANGIPKPGFIHGNNYWLGIKTQCLDIVNSKPLKIHPDLRLNNSKYRNVDEEFSPFEIDYFVVRARHNSTNQYHFRIPLEDIITLGLCLPSSCTNEEISQIINKIFQDRILFVSDLYSIDLKLESVATLKNDYQWLFDWQTIVTGIALIIVILMVIFGTGYDISMEQKRLQNYDHNNQNNNDVVQTDQSIVIQRILLSFSVYSNTKSIFNTEDSTDSIATIHGLKAILMIWIILCHTFIYSADYVDNVYLSFRQSEILITDLISNGHLFVDTFFLLSGFLISWSHFNAKRKVDKGRNINKCSFNWNVLFMRIFKRIIRITPSYLLLLGIAEMYYKWIIPLSIFETIEKPEVNCHKYWWWNILYLNNFFQWHTTCLSWSWYLSVDMQFFIIGQFLLILSDRNFNLSRALFFDLLILSMIIPGCVSYFIDFSYTPDDLISKLNIIYTPPWIRIAPYLIGMMTAYILVKSKGKLTFNKRVLWLFWTTSILCIIIAIFGLAGLHFSYATVAIYVALHRTIYAIAIAWILIACYTNHAGIVKTVLAAKIWFPLSKLTYCVYLINPIIISSIHLLAEVQVHYNIILFFTLSIGIAVLSFIFAYVLAIFIEWPFLRLINHFLRTL